MNIERLLLSYSRELRQHFDEIAAEIDHHGDAGTEREHKLIELLGRFLPRRAGLGQGFVIDTSGNTSGQIDVVIYDQSVGTVFQVGGQSYFPCESVLAVGQVKTRLDGPDLANSLENIASAKRLDRLNRGRALAVTGPGVSLKGFEFDPKTNACDQILGFVFAGRSQLTRNTVVDRVRDWNATHPRTEWPNAIAVADGFLISYEGERGLISSAMDAKKLYATVPAESQKVVLLLFCILNDMVNSGHVARPVLFDYASVKGTVHDDFELGGV